MITTTAKSINELLDEIDRLTGERNKLLEKINTIGVRCDEILTWATIDSHARKVLTEISNDCDLAWNVKPQRATTNE